MHCAGLCGAVPRLSSMAHPLVTLFSLVSSTTRHRTSSRLSLIKMRASSPLCVNSVPLRHSTAPSHAVVRSASKFANRQHHQVLARWKLVKTICGDILRIARTARHIVGKVSVDQLIRSTKKFNVTVVAEWRRFTRAVVDLIHPGTSAYLNGQACSIPICR